MKALVLAGGVGSRLRPITHTSAKQLIPVANKPVLFYGLEAIREGGIEEVGIVVGSTAPEIQRVVGDGSQFGLQVTYLPQEAPRGLAHAVLISRDYLGDDDFVMYLGDNFIVGGIKDIVERFRQERPHAQIMLTRVADPHAFGVAEMGADGRVIGVEEKPEHPKSDLALVGVYVFSPVVHDAVAELKPSWRNELEITDAVQWMIDRGHRVDSTMITGYWKDTGNLADMLEMNRFVLGSVEPLVEGKVDDRTELIGPVVISAGADVSGSRIVGPVVVGAGSIIRNSYLGPYTSIDCDCTLLETEIEHSIVLRGAYIEGIGRIEFSMIGREARVVPGPRVPKTHRFVLGDHSEVRVGV
ncbi:glucose-1-phosphate thymidylyltransferase [Micromonospora sp. KC207]|uniref:Glucose-1-phosphate thymidylyltransferase n=1 Tax=Micromonospora carbonacea TaxID=47853 RepID=A0A7D6CAS8_9ACTN|nr:MULTISPECIES: glucose-1-phosphate thymidylyltransferase [unclassified Micromonospora]EEP73303.1 glucose-1-phosphate thymidyltransferase [Micromonospora sp. ATCC 39149]QLJ99322.1 glucose-1-phosphate thymidylyltransferase [Micromonospora carbonacea]TDC67371.1 glucose-1-phosphate thymidylyltransferase [Micromonospora sp. KC207]